MLRVGCVGLFGVLLTSVVAAGPSGKVVRIERPRTLAAFAPILCEVKENKQGVCLGGEPRRGDIVAVVSDQKVLAEARVTGTTSPGPGCDGIFNITVEVVTGDLSQRSRGGGTVGLIDPTLDERVAKTVAEKDVEMPPTADPDTKPLLGVDRDGNGSADVLITYTKCSGAMFECFEVWSRRDRVFARTWAGNIKSCIR